MHLNLTAILSGLATGKSDMMMAWLNHKMAPPTTRNIPVNKAQPVCIRETAKLNFLGNGPATLADFARSAHTATIAVKYRSGRCMIRCDRMHPVAVFSPPSMVQGPQWFLVKRNVLQVQLSSRLDFKNSSGAYLCDSNIIITSSNHNRIVSNMQWLILHSLLEFQSVYHFHKMGTLVPDMLR